MKMLTSTRLCDADDARCGENLSLRGRSLHIKFKDGLGEGMEL